MGGDYIPGHKQLSVRLSDEDLERIHKFARKNNIAVAEQARRYIIKGMSVEAYQNDEEKILANTRAALKEVLDPQIERMVKIMVKSSIASSVNLLYTSMLLSRLCAREARPKLESFMENARHMGIKFVQLGKGSVDEFLKSSMEALNAMWEDG